MDDQEEGIGGHECGKVDEQGDNITYQDAYGGANQEGDRKTNNNAIEG